MLQLALVRRDAFVNRVPDEGMDERERWALLEQVDAREHRGCGRDLPVLETCERRGMIAIGAVAEDRDRACEPAGL